MPRVVWDDEEEESGLDRFFRDLPRGIAEPDALPREEDLRREAEDKYNLFPEGSLRAGPTSRFLQKLPGAPEPLVQGRGRDLPSRAINAIDVPVATAAYGAGRILKGQERDPELERKIREGDFPTLTAAKDILSEPESEFMDMGPGVVARRPRTAGQQELELALALGLSALTPGPGEIGGALGAARKATLADNLLTSLTKVPPSIMEDAMRHTRLLPYAVQVGRDLEDPADMLAVWQLITKSKRVPSEGTVIEMIEHAKGLKPSAVGEAAQMDLFGDAIKEAKPILELGEVSDYVRGQLGADKRLFGYVSRPGRAEELKRAGNMIDVEESRKISEEAAGVVGVFDALKTKRGPVQEALYRGAERLAAGEKGPGVKQETLDGIRSAVERVLTGEPEPVRGPRVAEPILEPEVARPAPVAEQALFEEIPTPEVIAEDVQKIVAEAPEPVAEPIAPRETAREVQEPVVAPEAEPLTSLLEGTEKGRPLETKRGYQPKLVETEGERAIREHQEAPFRAIEDVRVAMRAAQETAAREAHGIAIASGKTPEQAKLAARRAAAIAGEPPTPPIPGGTDDIMMPPPPRTPKGLEREAGGPEIPSGAGFAVEGHVRPALDNNTMLARKIAGTLEGSPRKVVEDYARSLPIATRRVAELTNEGVRLRNDVYSSIGLDPKMTKDFVRLLEGEDVKDAAPKVRSIAERAREWFDARHQAAIEAFESGQITLEGLNKEVGYIVNYFPRYYDNLEPAIRRYMSDDVNGAVDLLAREYKRSGKPVPSREALKAELSALQNRIIESDRTHTFSGHLEMPRERDVGGYLADTRAKEWRPGDVYHVFDRYNIETAMRVADAEAVGKNAELFTKARDAVPNVELRQLLTRGRRQMLGKRASEDASYYLNPYLHAVQNAFIMRHFGLGGIDNLLQPWQTTLPRLIKTVGVKKAIPIQLEALRAQGGEFARQVGLVTKRTATDRDFAERVGAVVKNNAEALFFLDSDPKMRVHIAQVMDRMSTKKERARGLATLAAEGARQVGRPVTKLLRVGDEANNVSAAVAGRSLAKELYDRIRRAAETGHRPRLEKSAEELRSLMTTEPGRANEMLRAAVSNTKYEDLDETLTVAFEGDLAYELAVQTQFRGTAAFRRQWELEPLGRLLATGRGFGQNYVEFLYKTVYLPAKEEGNYAPLAAAAGAGIIGTEVARELRDLVQGKDPRQLHGREEVGVFGTGELPDQLAMRALNNLFNAWRLGYVYDAVATVVGDNATFYDREGGRAKRAFGAAYDPFAFLEDAHGKPGLIGATLKSIDIGRGGQTSYRLLEEKTGVFDTAVGAKVGPLEALLIGGTKGSRRTSPYMLDVTSSDRLNSLLDALGESEDALEPTPQGGGGGPRIAW